MVGSKELKNVVKGQMGILCDGMNYKDGIIQRS